MNGRTLAAVTLLGGIALLLLLLPLSFRAGEYLVAGTDKIYALVPVAGALVAMGWSLLLVARGEQGRLFRFYLVVFPLISVLKRRLVLEVRGIELTVEIVLALALLLYFFWNTNRTREATGWLVYFVLLLLAAGLSSAALNGLASPPVIWGILLEAALPMSLFWMTLRLTRTREDLESTVRAALLSMLLFSALSLVWVFVLDQTTNLVVSEVLTAQSRISGGFRRLLVGAGFVSANVGNRLFILLLPVAIASIVGHVFTRRNLLHLLAILTAFYFIVATEHRAALLGAMIVFAAFFFFGQTRSVRPWIKALIFLIMVVVLQGPIVDYLSRRVLLDEGLLMDGSARKRFVMWQFAWELFRQHPLLGIGPYGYLEASMHTRAQAITAHNYYVTMLAEQGLLGLFSYLAIVGTIFMRGLRNARLLVDRNLRQLNFGLLLGLFTYQFALLFAGGRLTHNGVIYIHALYWVVVGLLWALPGIARREAELESAPETSASSRAAS